MVKLLLLCIAVLVSISGCGSSGSMVVSGLDRTTGKKTEVVYTKYFDGADWVIQDKLGMSVVIDHGASISRHGDDSYVEGSTVVYFWNLSPQSYKLTSLSIAPTVDDIKNVKDVVIGAGPNIRTAINGGTAELFSYAISHVVDVTIGLNGQTIKKRINVVRRTEKEIKRYWGTPGALPPYPWFASSSKEKSAAAADSNNAWRQDK